MKSIILITDKKIKIKENDKYNLKILDVQTFQKISAWADFILIDTDAKDYLSVLDKKNNAKIWALTKDTTKQNVLNLYNAGFDNVTAFPADINALCKTIINPDNETFFPQKQNLKKVLAICNNTTELNKLNKIIKSTQTLFSVCTTYKHAENELKNNDFDLIFVTNKQFLSKTDNKNNKAETILISEPFDTKKILKYINGQKQTQPHADSDLNEQSETFIAALTHDLKSPILAEQNIIRQMLAGKFGTVNPTQAELLTEILNSRDYMKRMIDNLLIRYKATSNNFEITKEISNYQDILETAIKEVSHITTAKDQKLNISYKAKTFELPLDKTEIKRVLVNLLANSAEYMASNGKIKVLVDEDEKSIITKIKDSGYGIPKEELPHIFEKNVTYAKKYRKIGSGLGLYIAKTIINAHGGEIFAESELNKGSTFTFTLPKE